MHPNFHPDDGTAVPASDKRQNHIDEEGLFRARILAGIRVLVETDQRRSSHLILRELATHSDWTACKTTIAAVIARSPARRCGLVALSLYPVDNRAFTRAMHAAQSHHWPNWKDTRPWHSFAVPSVAVRRIRRFAITGRRESRQTHCCARHAILESENGTASL